MGDEYRGDAYLRNALVLNAQGDFGEDRDWVELVSFLRYLDEHYTTRLPPTRNGGFVDENFFSLGLGLASLDRDELYRRFPQMLPQIALIGPTQAGKSSWVNWLLGEEVAEVSPLAGFTVNPQGFCWGRRTEETANALNGFFRGLRRVETDQVARDRFDCYTLTELSGPTDRFRVPAACIWDTPDFDSVDSESYRRNVLRVAALADVIVLVLSKDKYSDQSVWEMVSLLQPLAHPTAIILNKVDESAHIALLASLAEKWHSARDGALPFVVTLPFLHAEASLPTSPIESLWRWIDQNLASLRRQHSRKRTRDLLQRHWEAWLGPVRAEQEAWTEWQTAIEEAIDEALFCYQRDYLDHPHHYETFQRALARLLTLLEIPGVSGVVSSARRMLTWPWRQVSTIGRQFKGGTVEEDPKSGEQVMLEQIVEHLLLRLQQTALARRDLESANQTWWKDLALVLRSTHGETKTQMRTAITAYTRSFQTEIDHTAQALYRRLEVRPMVLNSLRATRITADAAALAFALHSGGIGIQDFVIAPATLSLTSMLTESALGRYVNRAVEELKARQHSAVSVLLRKSLGESLKMLPDRLDDTQHFKLSPATVARVEDLLSVYG